MWDNEALQETLRLDTGSSEYLEEELTIASARVNALRCHGYKTEARRLAVAVVRGVKCQIWRRVEQHKQFGEKNGKIFRIVKDDVFVKLQEEVPAASVVTVPWRLTTSIQPVWVTRSIRLAACLIR